MNKFSIFLFLNSFTVLLNAQNFVNDCSGAIKICGDGAISSNANGVGTQEQIGLNKVTSGFVTLYISDLKGCAIVSSEIAVLVYDNFLRRIMME